MSSMLLIRRRTPGIINIVYSKRELGLWNTQFFVSGHKQSLWGGIVIRQKLVQITKPEINSVAPAWKLSKPLSVLPIKAITIPTTSTRRIARMAVKTQANNQVKNDKENQRGPSICFFTKY